MRSLLQLSLLGLLIGTLGCASKSTGDEPAPDKTPKVRIENRTSSDVDIYVRPALARPIRLGFVPASETVDFILARGMVSGAASFSLEARPIREAGRAVVSEPLTARPGEEIFWSIPPQ